MYKLDVVAVVFCRLITWFFLRRFEEENQRQNESGSLMLKFLRYVKSLAEQLKTSDSLAIIQLNHQKINPYAF